MTDQNGFEKKIVYLFLERLLEEKAVGVGAVGKKEKPTPLGWA